MSRTTDRLRRLLADNPPEDIPFFPGAATSGRVGLRESRELLDAGASPMHFGCDRFGGSHLEMPFDGSCHWRRTGGVSGSVLTLTPGHFQEMVLQVFHTESTSPLPIIETSCHLSAGDKLPARSSNLGLSVSVGDSGGDGSHTHTEVIFKYDRDLFDLVRDDLPAIVECGRPNEELLEAHAAAYGLNAERLIGEVTRQIKHWGIRDFYPRCGVRYSLPDYRQPPWIGKTLHVDSKWLLKI